MDLPKDTIWTRLKIICGSRRSLKIQVYLNSIFLVVFHFLFGFGWFLLFILHPYYYFLFNEKKEEFSRVSPSQVLLWLWSITWIQGLIGTWCGGTWNQNQENQWIKWIFRLVLFRCVWPFLWWSSCMTLFLRTLFIKLDYQSKEQRFILHLPLWFVLHLHYTYLLVLHPFPSLVV